MTRRHAPLPLRWLALWLGLVYLGFASAPAHADPVRIHGVVRRVDTKAPIAGAEIRITSGISSLKPLGETITDDRGMFTVDIDTKRQRVTCEAIAAGFYTQRVSIDKAKPSCELELESQLTFSEILEQSPKAGRGPGLTFTAQASSPLTIAELTLRLQLAKPTSCGGGGETQQYDLDGAITIAADRQVGTISANGTSFEVTGFAPLQTCDKTAISLLLRPAAPLPVGRTRIVVTLPQTLTLMPKKQPGTKRQMSLTPPAFRPTYESQVQRIDVEIVTSHGSKASAHLDGLSIPVGAK